MEAKLDYSVCVLVMWLSRQLRHFPAGAYPPFHSFEYPLSELLMRLCGGD